MSSDIRTGLAASLNPRNVDELLAAHEEVKRNFYLGGLRLSAVEGGRFCEAAFRLLEEITTGTFASLGTQIDSEKLFRTLAALPGSKFPDTVRLHIPRALRLVYDIRNKRDAAHLADGIDPNVQDATLVVAATDWVLAEFVRLYHDVGPDEAHAMVTSIVARAAPVVQDFDGFLKVLNPHLGAADHCLVVLYQRGERGATFDELSAWARPGMRANLRRTLNRLTNEKSFTHSDGVQYQITRSGEQDVEARGLIEPDRG